VINEFLFLKQCVHLLNINYRYDKIKFISCNFSCVIECGSLLTIFLCLMNAKDIHLDLLRKLESKPECTQREISKEMGVSLGKVNYCLQSIIQKGFAKIDSFKNSKYKTQYSYLLTPSGVEEKTKLTIEFLKAKTKEYEDLKKEVERIENAEKNKQ